MILLPLLNELSLQRQAQLYLHHLESSYILTLCVPLRPFVVKNPHSIIENYRTKLLTDIKKVKIQAEPRLVAERVMGSSVIQSITAARNN